MSDGLDRTAAPYWIAAWMNKAEHNISVWGDEGLQVLTLCAVEELGELSQAILQARYEGLDHTRILHEIDDLAALVFQLRQSYENKYGL